MKALQDLLLIAVGSAFVNNVVLSQFLGICPFLGVSKNVKTAAEQRCGGGSSLAHSAHRVHGFPSPGGSLPA